MGSFYVKALDKVMPKVKDEDLLKSRDNLGEYFILLKKGFIPSFSEGI